jgi:hypothetical protein
LFHDVLGNNCIANGASLFMVIRASKQVVFFGQVGAYDTVLHKYDSTRRTWRKWQVHGVHVLNTEPFANTGPSGHEILYASVERYDITGIL